MNSKILKYAVAIFAQFFFIVTSSCATSFQVYRTSDSQIIPTEQAFDEMAKFQVVVVGETHYDEIVQATEGQVLEQLSLRNPSYQMAWEFLNYSDQDQLQSTFDEFSSDSITSSEWIARWFPNNSANHEVYLPMFEVAKIYSQKVVGTNASRTLKKRLMNGGRGIIHTDSEVWPFSHDLIDAPKEYLERFKEIMGGHADRQTIEKYYLAQFYTDAYMASSIHSKLVDGPLMMVVGHFHSDYGHGLPFYLKELGIKDVLNIRIINASGLSEDELSHQLKSHPQYGALGEYILIAK